MVLTSKTRPVVMQFTRMVNQWKAYERRAHALAGDLFMAGELQVLKVVAEFPAKNTTELAAELGVTKGAVSQAVGKLASRGYLEKYRAPDNDRESYTRLTLAGSRVYQAHMAQVEAQLAIFERLLSEAQPSEVAFMLEFVAKVEAFFRDQLEN